MIRKATSAGTPELLRDKPPVCERTATFGGAGALRCSTGGGGARPDELRGAKLSHMQWALSCSLRKNVAPSTLRKLRGWMLACCAHQPTRLCAKRRDRKEGEPVQVARSQVLKLSYAHSYSNSYSSELEVRRVALSSTHQVRPSGFRLRMQSGSRITLHGFSRHTAPPNRPLYTGSPAAPRPPL